MEIYDEKSYGKKSRLSILYLWMPELSNFDLNIGFLVQNCQLEMSRILKFCPEIRHVQTLATKKTISDRMHPPYEDQRKSNNIKKVSGCSQLVLCHTCATAEFSKTNFTTIGEHPRRNQTDQVLNPEKLYT